MKRSRSIVLLFACMLFLMAAGWDAWLRFNMPAEDAITGIATEGRVMAVSGFTAGSTAKKDTFTSFNTPCLTSPVAGSQTIVQVGGPGANVNNMGRARRRFGAKAMNGFAPFLKKGSISGVIHSWDFRLGNPRLPSPDFCDGGFTVILRRLRP